jgi:hypothetical protein
MNAALRSRWPWSKHHYEVSTSLQVPHCCARGGRAPRQDAAITGTLEACRYGASRGSWLKEYFCPRKDQSKVQSHANFGVGRWSKHNYEVSTSLQVPYCCARGGRAPFGIRLAPGLWIGILRKETGSWVAECDFLAERTVDRRCANSCISSVCDFGRGAGTDLAGNTSCPAIQKFAGNVSPTKNRKQN